MPKEQQLFFSEISQVLSSKSAFDGFDKNGNLANLLTYLTFFRIVFIPKTLLPLIQAHPHIRFNPLTGDNVLVCPNRSKRPWAGLLSNQTSLQERANDPSNPLCPGAIRPNGQQNPNYER